MEEKSKFKRKKDKLAKTTQTHKVWIYCIENSTTESIPLSRSLSERFLSCYPGGLVAMVKSKGLSPR